MKFFKFSLIRSIMITFLFLSSVSQAVTLDVSKFRSKAKASLENVIGRQNIVGREKIIFRDGAGSTDLEPLFDYASFIYVVTPKEGIFPTKDLRLGYRLTLKGNEDMVLFSDSSNGDIAIAMPGEGVATLDSNASKNEAEQLVQKLTQLSPSGDFQHLAATGVITFIVPILESAVIFKELTQSKFITSIELSYENYRIPFEFDPILTVKDTGKIDADKYRELTKKLKMQGLNFTTETTVPQDLQ